MYSQLQPQFTHSSLTSTNTKHPHSQTPLHSCTLSYVHHALNNTHVLTITFLSIEYKHTYYHRHFPPHLSLSHTCPHAQPPLHTHTHTHTHTFCRFTSLGSQPSWYGTRPVRHGWTWKEAETPLLFLAPRSLSAPSSGSGAARAADHVPPLHGSTPELRQAFAGTPGHERLV